VLLGPPLSVFRSCGGIVNELPAQPSERSWLCSVDSEEDSAIAIPAGD